MKWQFRTGFEQGVLCGKGKVYVDDPYAVARDSASVGTLVHALVEAHKLGKPAAVADGADPRIRSGFEAYLAWERQSKLKVVATETPMVSERYQYGGTPDAIGEIDGKLVCMDWKTSNSIYTDHLIQVAAYRALWDENNPDQKLTGGSHIMRFSKEDGDFAHHYFPDLKDAEELFFIFLKAYKLDQKLKNRVK